MVLYLFKIRVIKLLAKDFVWRNPPPQKKKCLRICILVPQSSWVFMSYCRYSKVKNRVMWSIQSRDIVFLRNTVVVVWGLSLLSGDHRRSTTQKRSHRLSLLFGGRNLFNAAIEFITSMIGKKRMNRRTHTWKNGCFGRMDNRLVPRNGHSCQNCSSNHP